MALGTLSTSDARIGLRGARRHRTKPPSHPPTPTPIPIPPLFVTGIVRRACTTQRLLLGSNRSDSLAAGRQIFVGRVGLEQPSRRAGQGMIQSSRSRSTGIDKQELCRQCESASCKSIQAVQDRLVPQLPIGAAMTAQFSHSHQQPIIFSARPLRLRGLCVSLSRPIRQATP